MVNKGNTTTCATHRDEAEQLIDQRCEEKLVEPASANGIDWHAHYVYAHEPKFREFGGEENKDVKNVNDATCALPIPISI